MRIKPFNYNKWHMWFAWRPVWIGSECVWLEYVYRRGDWVGYYDPFWRWEYKLENDDVSK